MSELLLFLFKANASLLLFCAAYYLLLRRLTFYVLNRVFLLVGILFSSIYPFIDFSVFFNREPIVISIGTFTPAIEEVVEHVSTFNYEMVLFLIFWLGVGFMTLRLFIRFLSLYRVHRGSVGGYVNNFPVRILHQNIGPFSFGKNIYINPLMHHSDELEAVLAHESIHVKQWHTVDILLAEFNVVLYWFNPGVWLMRKAVKENIEFITDKQVLKKGADRKTYQYSMLRAASRIQATILTNHFNLINIKQRIIMMNRKHSSVYQLMRYMFILPGVFTIVLIFSVVKATIALPEIKSLSLNKEVSVLNVPFNVLPEPLNTKGVDFIKKQKTDNENKYLSKDSVSQIPNVNITIRPIDTALDLSHEVKSRNTENGRISFVSLDDVGNLNESSVKLIFDDQEKKIKAVIDRTSETSFKSNTGSPKFFINGKNVPAEMVDALKSSDVHWVQMKKGDLDGYAEMHVYTKS